MSLNKYKSYPEGYNSLCHDVLPFFLRPMQKMLIPLFIKILIDD